MYDENSPKGQILRRQMQQGESQIKQMLRQKLSDFNGSSNLIEPGEDLG